MMIGDDAEDNESDDNDDQDQDQEEYGGSWYCS